MKGKGMRLKRSMRDPSLYCRVSILLVFMGAMHSSALELLPTPNKIEWLGGRSTWTAPKTSIDSNLPREGYQLTITQDGVTLVGGSQAGLFYGQDTLEQLAAPEGKFLSCVKITDAPKYAYRGFMHDTGRNFQTIESLKKQFDLFAKYRINIFHWHLTDHPAWRIQSKIYPQLNSAKVRRPGRDVNDTYSFDDIRELIRYGRERNIRIIPELDMPGHSESFRTTFGFSMDSEKGIKVVKELLTEFCQEIPVSDCPMIHIGSDEISISEPIKFISTFEKHLESLGRRAVV